MNEIDKHILKIISMLNHMSTLTWGAACSVRSIAVGPLWGTHACAYPRQA